jgi:SsrA-binding protein
MAILAENKKAWFDYEILETFEAGIQLQGFEVKSVRLGRMDLSSSYVLIRNHESYLLNAKIHPFQPKNAPENYDPQKTRKLLLGKKELKYLEGKLTQRGLTLVPLRVYTKGRFVKLGVALAKGKKGYEKRELLRKKAMEREIERTLKRY